MPSGLEPEITRFERAVVRPATLASNLAIGPRLELGRRRLRTDLLEPLCIADQAFGASSRELRPPANKAGFATTGLPASLRNWCSVSESNRAGPEGQQLYRLHGVRPRLTLHCGAPRSARTFVSCSSGRRLSCLSYRGKLVELSGVEPAGLLCRSGP